MRSRSGAYENCTIQTNQKLSEIVNKGLIHELYRLYNYHAKNGLRSYQKTYINQIITKRSTNGATALQLMLEDNSINISHLICIIKLFYFIDPSQLNIQDDFGYNALCYALKRNIAKHEINGYGTTPEITKLLIELGSEVSIVLRYQEFQDKLKMILSHKETLFWAFLNLFCHSKLFESEILLAKLNVIEGIIYSKEDQRYIYIKSQKYNVLYTIHDALWLYLENSIKQEQKELCFKLSNLLFLSNNQGIINQSQIIKQFTRIKLTIDINEINILHFMSKVKHLDPKERGILKYITKKLLTELTFDINAPDSYGRTALHTTATHGNLEVAKILTADERIDLMKLDYIMQTPLHRSLLSNRFDVVKFFLDLGYDPDLRDLRGYSALHRAVSKQNIEIIKLLLEHGAKVETRNKWGATPITDSISNCASDDIQELLKEYSKDLRFHTITMQEKLCNGCCVIS